MSAGTDWPPDETGLAGMAVSVDGEQPGILRGSYRAAPEEYPDVRRLVVELQDGEELDIDSDRVEVVG